MIKFFKVMREYLLKINSSIIYKIVNTSNKEILKKNSIAIIIIMSTTTTYTITTIRIMGISTITTITISIICGISIGIGIIILIDKINYLLLNSRKFNQWINKQNKIINHRLTFIHFFKSIFLCFLPSECQEHFKDETKNILETNKKYIAHYKVIKKYFCDYLLIRIIKDCYLRVKNVIFRRFIQ